MISGNPDLKASCQEALAGNNLSIQFSPSLHAGLLAVEEGETDVILLDAAALLDPAETDFLPQLWERDADRVCLVLSEPSVLDKALKAIQAGAYDVVFLPVIPDLLALRVDHALERRERAMELKRLRTFEMFASQLWSVAKGEMDGFDQFNKDFVGMAAFRLTVAHEFRAPLAALQSFLLLLIKGYIRIYPGGSAVQDPSACH